MTSSSSTNNCSRCGSPLIQISEVTEQLEGARFPQTTTLYRCSNQECQNEREKETEKRIKIQEKRVTAEQRQTETKLREEKVLQKITTEETVAS